MAGTSIVMQIREWTILKENTSLYPWYQNPCIASIFLHARPHFKKEKKKNKFSGQQFNIFAALPSQNINICSKFLQMTIRLMLWTGNS